VPVTVSVGVAGFPDHASTLERLDRLADAALYVAKRQGRNRVELASADAGPDLPGPVLPEATVNGSGPASV
jgi:predicted signal transduction protein with EAL and GGDEF domain